MGPRILGPVHRGGQDRNRRDPANAVFLRRRPRAWWGCPLCGEAQHRKWGSYFDDSFGDGDDDSDGDEGGAGS